MTHLCFAITQSVGFESNAGSHRFSWKESNLRSLCWREAIHWSAHEGSLAGFNPRDLKDLSWMDRDKRRTTAWETSVPNTSWYFTWAAVCRKSRNIFQRLTENTKRNLDR